MQFKPSLARSLALVVLVRYSPVAPPVTMAVRPVRSKSLEGLKDSLEKSADVDPMVDDYDALREGVVRVRMSCVVFSVGVLNSLRVSSALPLQGPHHGFFQPPSRLHLAPCD